MISIIITSYKEEKTIGRAIESFTNQNIKEKYEIIAVAPDIKTKEVIEKYSSKNKNIKFLRDREEGKPAALNLALKKAKGKILILTDGDVFVDKNSIKELLKKFNDKKIGAVTGRPISISDRTTMLGYISHLLTDIGAHETRLNLSKKEKFIVGSGYLMAIRSGLIKSIPEDTLSDDALISHLIYEQGYKIAYAPEAKVFVKYPSTIKDWLKQKKRSTGGYIQLKKYTDSKVSMRSFTKESLGIFRIFSYQKNIKEFIWTINLVLLRIYLWVLVFIDIKIKRKGIKDIWLPVESTK